jgi:hypothetical protein
MHPAIDPTPARTARSGYRCGMPATPPTHALSPAAAGLAWGLLAAAIWTV